MSLQKYIVVEYRLKDSTSEEYRLALQLKQLSKGRPLFSRVTEAGWKNQIDSLHDKLREIVASSGYPMEYLGVTNDQYALKLKLKVYQGGLNDNK